MNFFKGTFVADYEYEYHFYQCALIFPQFYVKHEKIGKCCHIEINKTH